MITAHRDPSPARLPARLLLSVVLALAAAGAQAFSPSFAVGAAVPTGYYATRRSPGPIVRASLTVGYPERQYVWLRVDGEGAWLLDEGGGHVLLGSVDGTLRSLGVFATVAAGPRREGVRPYAFMSAGPQWLRVEGATNPYGVSLGLRGGAGIRAKARGLELEAEVGAHVVTSDFGTGHEFKMGSFVPVTLGVRF
jgi:hypothetical protein